MIELHTTWNLRAIMASKGLFQTTDLRPLLAERGVELSRSKCIGWSQRHSPH